LSTPTGDNPQDDSEDSYVVLGKIIGFFGVKGWVKVHSDTNPRENIVAYSQWWLGDAKHRSVIKVRGGKRSGKNVVAQLVGVDTREQAESFIGKEIAVLRTMLPKLDSSEIYWTDLIGCTVETLQGDVIGPVDRLFETGANDVMVVIDHRPDSATLNGEILVPWLRPSVITSVDLETRRIAVDWDPDF